MNTHRVFVMQAIILASFFSVSAMEYGTDAYTAEGKNNSLSLSGESITEESSKRDSFKQRRTISDTHIDEKRRSSIDLKHPTSIERKKSLKQFVINVFGKKKKETFNQPSKQFVIGSPLVKTPSVPEMSEIEKAKEEIKQQELEEKIEAIRDAIKLNDDEKVTALLYGVDEPLDMNIQDKKSGNTLLIEAVINYISWEKELQQAKKILEGIIAKGMSGGEYGDLDLISSGVDYNIRNQQDVRAVDIAIDAGSSLAARLRQLTIEQKRRSAIN